jgi:hypothetical protein
VIRKSAVLRCDRDRAFALFTERASEWWPPSRRHTGDRESDVVLEPAGRFFERARDGREVELGRVLAWEAPARLALDFYPGTGAEHPTHVVISFTAVDGGTLVVVEHRPTPASEALWDAGAPAFARSWDAVLAGLRAAGEAVA